MAEEQQFCLRWNNFQAYITSQFESLRDDEDFVDVTLACGGQRLGAHKVVLSACSPFFKELFKTNPCPHPIIFMRDVEVEHVVSLLEFMYAGEVNVAQASLSGFLRTAESLQIRGLTDATKPSAPVEPHTSDEKSCVTSTREELDDVRAEPCSETINPFAVAQQQVAAELDLVEPKLEIPDYSEDDDDAGSSSRDAHYLMEVDGRVPATDCKAGTSAPSLDSFTHHTNPGMKRMRLIDLPLAMRLHPAREEPQEENTSALIRLGDGVEVREDQLRAVKWGDYRKLTRGLATILFSPVELATCSVTGQRWSRAGSSSCTAARPVKPALPRHKVQALVSYVAQRFPHVEVSRIKQVLAYKCKENSTALKMKAVRYFGHEAANAAVSAAHARALQ